MTDPTTDTPTPPVNPGLPGPQDRTLAAGQRVIVVQALAQAAGQLLHERGLNKTAAARSFTRAELAVRAAYFLSASDVKAKEITDVMGQTLVDALGAEVIS